MNACCSKNSMDIEVSVYTSLIVWFHFRGVAACMVTPEGETSITIVGNCEAHETCNGNGSPYSDADQIAAHDHFTNIRQHLTTII